MWNEQKSENEDKKAFLRKYLQKKAGVRRIEQQLEELQLNKISPSAKTGDGMPRGAGQSDLSTYAVKLDELENRLIEKRRECIRAFSDIQSAIEEMENEHEKQILTYRYLLGWGWEKISSEMGYTLRHITRMHGSALKNFKIP